MSHTLPQCIIKEWVDLQSDCDLCVYKNRRNEKQFDSHSKTLQREKLPHASFQVVMTLCGTAVSLVQNTSLTDGGPMPNSPGSMVNQYRLDEDDVEHHLGVRDLFITVDKPESHVTAIETFITYRVVTKVGTSPFCFGLVLQNKHVTF